MLWTLKDVAVFTEADYPRQLANGLKKTNLRLARRKPYIRGMKFKCSAKKNVNKAVDV